MASSSALSWPPTGGFAVSHTQNGMTRFSGRKQTIVAALVVAFSGFAGAFRLKSQAP